MSPAATTACIIAVIAEIVFVPLYLKKMWPTKNLTSLAYKMVCATAYVVIALAAALSTGGISGYSALMLSGFAGSWLGDLMLHIPKPTKKFFLIGTFFFATAHVFYCLAYIHVQKQLFPELPAFYWWEFALTAAIMLAYFSACIIKKISFGVLAIPMVFYGAFVTMMMIKSAELAVRTIASGSASLILPAVLLLCGGLCFIQSDASLGLITFDTRYKKFKLKVYNIITYFAAQVCLAFTVFFFN